MRRGTLSGRRRVSRPRAAAGARGRGAPILRGRGRRGRGAVLLACSPCSPGPAPSASPCARLVARSSRSAAGRRRRRRRRRAVDGVPRRRHGDRRQPLLLRGRRLHAVPPVLVPAHRHVPAVAWSCWSRRSAGTAASAGTSARSPAIGALISTYHYLIEWKPSLEGGVCRRRPVVRRHLVPRARLRDARLHGAVRVRDHPRPRRPPPAGPTP